MVALIQGKNFLSEFNLRSRRRGRRRQLPDQNAALDHQVRTAQLDFRYAAVCKQLKSANLVHDRFFANSPQDFAHAIGNDQRTWGRVESIPSFKYPCFASDACEQICGKKAGCRSANDRDLRVGLSTTSQASS